MPIRRIENRQHITDIEDLPRNPDAVFNHDGHIKPSFMLKLALETLKTDVARIEMYQSRRKLTEEEKNAIERMRGKIARLESQVPATGMSEGQFTKMRVHVMGCRECRSENSKIRGDLPENGLPFE